MECYWWNMTLQEGRTSTMQTWGGSPLNGGHQDVVVRVKAEGT